MRHAAAVREVGWNIEPDEPEPDETDSWVIREATEDATPIEVA